MSLELFVRKRYLKKEQTSADEIGSILEVVERDLELCKSESLNLDWRFNIAYNAALQLCKSALRAAGYRTSSGSPSHFVTIQCLPFIVGPAQTQRADFLDSCRSLRNQAEYDAAGVATESDVQGLIEETELLHGEVLAWLRQHHPDLLAE